jgi:MoaA/NifB/PqqE/SkfB family radical SAM enzyme
MKPIILDSVKHKRIVAPDFNHFFNKETGLAMTWGKTQDEDPEFCKYGPLLADIEVGEICHMGCSFCYKSNTTAGENMSLETFKKLLAKLPKTVGQIAFGIGSIDSHPELYDIMRHTRDNGVIPNITINGFRMKDSDYDNLAKLCGAVAVSNYRSDVCYETIKRLNEASKQDGATLKQINIHQLLSENTYDKCFSLMRDYLAGKIEGLNAIVFLLLKPKGSRNHYEQLRSQEKYNELLNFAIDNNVPIGFDSCGAAAFVRGIQGRPNVKQMTDLAEPCESTLFSLYINVRGETFPCSFCEGEKDYKPINILECEDFLKDVWYAPSVVEFRSRSISSKDSLGCRNCVAFDLRLE